MPISLNHTILNNYDNRPNDYKESLLFVTKPIYIHYFLSFNVLCLNQNQNSAIVSYKSRAIFLFIVIALFNFSAHAEFQVLCNRQY
jgi:hypothetical protein